MKFKIGDRVKYDSGEWLFYGSVNAIFDHSTSLCYRINVDKIIKRSCKLSITQFEFELEADEDVEQVAPVKEKGRQLKKIQEQTAVSSVVTKESVAEIVEKQTDVIVETATEKKKIGRPKKIQIVEQKPVKKKATWLENFEKYKNGDRSNAINAWAALNRKEYKTGKMNEERKDLLIGIRFPLMIVRKKRLNKYNKM